MTNVYDIYDKINLKNPVFVKEIRTKMRGSRVFLLVSIYTLIMSILVLLIMELGKTGNPLVHPSYTIMSQTYYPGQPYIQPTPTSWIIGQTIFRWITYLQIVIICLLTPAVTAGTLTMEKERGTLSLLLLTSIKPIKIVQGKLKAAIGFLVVMIFCSLPMIGIVFFLGGVSLFDMVSVFLIQLVCIITMGMIGMTISIICRKSSNAYIITYGIIGLLCIGPIIFELFGQVLRYSQISVWGLLLAFILTYIFLAPIAYGVYNILEWIYKWIQKRRNILTGLKSKSIVSPGVRKLAGFGLIANLFCYFAYQPPWIDIIIALVGDIRFMVGLLNPFILVNNFLEITTIHYGYYSIYGNRGFNSTWIIILSAYIILSISLFFLNRKLIQRFGFER